MYIFKEKLQEMQLTSFKQELSKYLELNEKAKDELVTRFNRKMRLSERDYERLPLIEAIQLTSEKIQQESLNSAQKNLDIINDDSEFFL